MEEDLFSDGKYITGPVNVARLEGNVNGIKKVIYLFMDYHIPVEYQTKCKNYRAVEIDNFLAKTFKKLNNSNITYDFFMEHRPSDTYYHKKFGPNHLIGNLLRNQLYIENVEKFYDYFLNYNTDTKKVNIAPAFKNVRFHYLDVRDILSTYFFETVNTELGRHIGIINTGHMHIDELLIVLDNIKQAIETVNALLHDAATSTNIVETKHIPIIDENRGINVEKITKIMQKITKMYNHLNIKQILNKEFDTVLKFFDDMLDTLNSTIDLVQTSNTKITEGNNTLNYQEDSDHMNYGLGRVEILRMRTDILIKLYILSTKILFTNHQITDIFMLRRFLDKDYITNAIVYSGAYHSYYYIYLLVNKFDFIITHVSYSSVDNLDDLNNLVRNNKYLNYIEYFQPASLVQCSDITDFPDNFL